MALPDPAIACLHADLVRKLTTENITSLITICRKKKIYIYIFTCKSAISLSSFVTNHGY